MSADRRPRDYWPLPAGAAPGAPGLEPRWTSSAKSGIGTAVERRSRVWFAVSHGIVDEVYYPRIDEANTRDMGLIVTDAGPTGAASFFSEEKRGTRSTLHLLAPGVPGYRLVNTCAEGRYRVVKTVLTDPERDVLVQHVRFRVLLGHLSDYRVYVLLAPHIGNQGYGNDAWLGDYKGVPMLFARRNSTTLALACTPSWRARSCGYVGVSDGWQLLEKHLALPAAYSEAPNGNVALTGELPLEPCSSGTPREAEFVVALAFGRSAAEAGQEARVALASPFQNILRAYVDGWRRFHEETVTSRYRPVAPARESTTPERTRRAAARDVARHGVAVDGMVIGGESMPIERRRGRDRRGLEHDGSAGEAHVANGAGPEPPTDGGRTPAAIDVGAELAELLDLARLSTALIATHEDKRAQGGIIASLSIPWGQTRGDHELGGYHLVWPRDLVESAGAMLAAGHDARARRTFRFLMSTQEPDGHWPQNMWLDGTPYWTGIQMDETAFPILLAELLHRERQLGGMDVWPVVQRAASFLVKYGPVTPQDRWEEDGGYSPFTLAVEIAALLAAAEFADTAGDRIAADYLRETADAWNEGIERWTYVTGTELARAVGVDGYYARIAPPDIGGPPSASSEYVLIHNRRAPGNLARYDSIVSPDALALVRFGLRLPDDPRIVNTVRVVDAILRRETCTGPIWYRYNGDGYGEHEDGAPFDGVGIGRGWPLLAGERGHYELAAGRRAAALQLLKVMRAQASDGGMLPEQVWDDRDLPERELYNGRATGSAMPLVWAHAEYLKLTRSIIEGRVFDMPPQAMGRYGREPQPARVAVWSRHNKVRAMSTGRVLRIQTDARAQVHWSSDDWRTTHDTPVVDTGLGVWAADLDTAALPSGSTVRFTLYWVGDARWEGEDFAVAVAAEPVRQATVERTLEAGAITGE